LASSLPAESGSADFLRRSFLHKVILNHALDFWKPFFNFFSIFRIFLAKRESGPRSRPKKVHSAARKCTKTGSSSGLTAAK
jgi:hypothetical protein